MIRCLTAFLLAFTLTGTLADKVLVGRFESRYRPAHTLQASFLERYTENGHVVRVEAGIAYFRRPGKMRWEYQAPENNLFLVDGKTAWFYVPADHTVTRVPAKESSDWRTPLALLAGEMKVSRVCARVQTATAEKIDKPGDAVLRCELRGAGKRSPDTNSAEAEKAVKEIGEAVLIEIVEKTGELVKITVRDPGGVSIEFQFTNWLADPPVEDSLFHFRVPPGVAIVNGELPEGNSGVSP